MHTPGPWTVNPCGTNNRTHASVTSPSGRPVASCRAYPNIYAARAEANANARLIAKAPDLKAALAWALDQIEDDLDPDHQAALAHARSLLED